MDKQVEKAMQQLAIHAEGSNAVALIRDIFKIGFDAGVEYAESKFDEEQQHIARAVAALNA